MKHFLIQTYFWLQKRFLETGSYPKLSLKKILVGNIVWLQKHILLKCLRQIFPLKYI